MKMTGHSLNVAEAPVDVTAGCHAGRVNDRADPSHRGRAVGPLLGGLALGYLAGRWRARGGFGSGVIF
ncbi:MAG: hypothetical protein ACXVD7_10235, partial [Actinomycetota bacterium]